MFQCNICKGWIAELGEQDSEVPCSCAMDKLKSMLAKAEEEKKELIEAIKDVRNTCPNNCILDDLLQKYSGV